MARSHLTSMNVFNRMEQLAAAAGFTMTHPPHFHYHPLAPGNDNSGLRVVWDPTC